MIYVDLCYKTEYVNLHQSLINAFVAAWMKVCFLFFRRKSSSISHYYNSLHLCMIYVDLCYKTEYVNLHQSLINAFVAAWMKVCFLFFRRKSSSISPYYNSLHLCIIYVDLCCKTKYVTILAQHLSMFYVDLCWKTKNVTIPAQHSSTIDEDLCWKSSRVSTPSIDALCVCRHRTRRA